MTVKELINSLSNGTDMPFAHFSWSKAPNLPYGVVSETDFVGKWTNNKKSEEKLIADVDVFFREDSDDVKASIEAVFDSLEIGYEVSYIAYEPENGYIHYTWKIEAVYG